jgi:PTS system ascorbate-specific IIA component
MLQSRFTVFLLQYKCNIRRRNRIYNSKFPQFPTYLVVFGAAQSDMAGILIIAHAPFASALRECITHIYGGLPARIGVIDVKPDCDPVEVRAFARSEIDRLKEENGAIVLTDVFGATPANIAQSLASNSVRVLAGVNLPMLVRAVCYRTTPLDTLAEKSLQGGSKGIQELDASTPVNPCAMASAAAAAAAAVTNCAAGAVATSCMPAKVAAH